VRPTRPPSARPENARPLPPVVRRDLGRGVRHEVRAGAEIAACAESLVPGARNDRHQGLLVIPEACPCVDELAVRDRTDAVVDLRAVEADHGDGAALLVQDLPVVHAVFPLEAR